jgi:hypothetical protein
MVCKIHYTLIIVQGKMNMLHIPPRGDLQECWLNPKYIRSIYYEKNTVSIELDRTTTLIYYESPQASAIAAIIFIKMLRSPNENYELPKAIGGSIRMNSTVRK